MGYSFAAGTTDGPGAFDFTQGTTTDNPLWNAVRDFLAAPTPDDIKCQYPKPILLSTGRVIAESLTIYSACFDEFRRMKFYLIGPDYLTIVKLKIVYLFDP